MGVKHGIFKRILYGLIWIVIIFASLMITPPDLVCLES